MAPDIFYMCDPEKNKLCTKESCYYNPLGIPRECRMTSHREFAANGTRYRFDEKADEWKPVPLELDLDSPAYGATPEEIVDILRKELGLDERQS